MSSSTCLLSRTAIREGDRIVAVLVTPRPREGAMPQEYGPLHPRHRDCAASFPIRGTYGLFGSFTPDEGQFAENHLLGQMETRDWAKCLETLHDEGIKVEDPTTWPRKTKKTQFAAFAFVHEDMLDELSIDIDPTVPLEQLKSLHADLADPDKRSYATYQILDIARSSRLFGDHAAQSSLSSYGRIGTDILSDHANRIFKKAFDATVADSFLDEAKDLLQSIADLTAFEYALQNAGTTLQPSVGIPARRSVSEKIALMTLDRVVRSRIANDVENDEPTSAIDEIRKLYDSLASERRVEDEKMEAHLASFSR